MPEVFVKFNSLEEAMAALNGSASVPASAPATPAFTPAPTPAYAPAPTPAAPFVPPAPTPAAAPAPAPVTPPAAPAPVAAPAAPTGITLQQVAAAAQSYAQQHGPKATKAVFQQFGANAVAEIAAEHYPAVMAQFGAY